MKFDKIRCINIFLGESVFISCLSNPFFPSIHMLLSKYHFALTGNIPLEELLIPYPGLKM